MSFLKFVPPQEADGLLKEQYERFGASLGQRKPPNLVKAWSLQPEVAKAWLDFGHIAMEKTGLSNKEIELMLTRVTHRLRCGYVTQNHAWILWRITGWTKEKVIVVIRDRRWDPLSRKERVLLAFADKICRRSHRTNQKDIDRLRAIGLEDDQVTAIVFLVGWMVSDAVIPNGLGPERDAFSRGFKAAIDWK
jgi:uncharacterized peroxidase-related enzyme